MQQRISFFAVPALAVMFSMSAFGAVTIVASGSGTANGTAVGDSSQTNSATANTFNILRNSAWKDASLLNSPLGLTGTARWVSHINNQNLGDGANGTWVDFYHTFQIADATILSSSLSILADDRADVYINDNVVALTGALAGSACNAFAIGCVATTQGNYANPIPGNLGLASIQGNYFLNVLRVRVYQDNGSGFGTAYLMNITSVPEPGFYGLLSLGLGGLALAVQRRRKNLVS